MQHEVVFYVVGDPAYTMTLHGQLNKRNIFVQENTKTEYAAALNVWKNLYQLNGMKGVYFTDFIDMKHSYPGYGTNRDIHTVERYIADNTLLFQNIKEVTYRPKQGDSWITPSFLTEIIGKYIANLNLPEALILIDENRGTINSSSEFNFTLPSKKFTFAVVRSPDKTLNLDWLTTSEENVWYCSLEDFNNSFARRFDYAIVTDGSKDVSIVQCDDKYGMSRTIYTLPVPSNSVVDKSGISDTFVAALTGHVHKQQQGLSLNTLVRATEFAIECCQEVIVKPFTCVTTRRL